MTLPQIEEMLGGSGYPVSYYSFQSPDGGEAPAPDPPFIRYSVPYNRNVSADGITVLNVMHIRVGLYTGEKNPADEKALEQIFQEHRIFYDKSETAIDSKGLFEAVYEFDMEEL